MNARARLANRRPSTTFDFTCGNLHYTCSYSRYTSGGIAELFLSNHKSNSHADTAAREGMIEFIKTSLEAQAGDPVKVIEGMVEPTTVPTTALPVLEPPKRKPNRLMMEVDTAIGPQERRPRKRVPSPAGT